MDLIIGANGNIGSELVKLYQAALRPYRVAVRSVDRFKVKQGEHSEVKYFDFDDPSTYQEVLLGIEAVFFIAPHRNPARSIKRWLAECQKVEIQHLIFSSGRTTGDVPGMPLNKVELLVKASGIPFTIIRPGWFMQNFISWIGGTIKKEKAFYLPAGEARTSFVDVRDIAATVFQILRYPGEHIDKTYEITGGASLNHHEVAEKLSLVLSTDIKYVPLSDSEYVQKMVQYGWTKSAAEYTKDLYTFVKSGKEDHVSTHVEHILGRPAMTFEGFTQDYKADLQRLID